MHANSIHTQYYEQNQGPFYNDISPPSSYTMIYKKQSKSISTSNLQKIQQNIKQYQQQIKNNKDIIHQLECQRKFFEKLSQKQINKIQQIDTHKIKTQYQNQIFKLKNQTAQIHQRITSLHQNLQQNQLSFKQTSLNLTTNKQFLIKALIQIEKQNQNYQAILIHEAKALEQLSQQYKENQIIIQQKENSYRKYIEIQIEIENIQKKFNNNNKK